MSISSIFSNSAADPLSQLYAPTSTTPATGITSAKDADGDTDGSSASSVSSAATSTSVSNGAKLLKQLQDLQKSNPTEFKKVTADIAAQLTAATQTAGGSEAGALTSLASRFTQASQTGSLSALKSGHHHGGHHHAADSSTSGTSSTSPAVSSAIAAYQQASGQSSPLSGATTDLRSQVSGIISRVLTTDLGSTPTSTATSKSAYA